MTEMTLQAGVFSVPVIVSSVTLLLIFLLTLPSVYGTARRIYSGRHYQLDEPSVNSYEDEDGVATEEARKAYSAAIPKYMALASASSGLIVNIFTNVYSEAQPALPSRPEHWLAFGSWVSR